jgi:hypothetical protein
MVTVDHADQIASPDRTLSPDETGDDQGAAGSGSGSGDGPQSRPVE